MTEREGKQKLIEQFQPLNTRLGGKTESGAACWCDAVLQEAPSDLMAEVCVSRLTAAPRSSAPLLLCTSQPAASAWTRSPTPSAGAARSPDVEHLHGEHDRSFRRSALVSVGPEVRLACAFAQSSFEALQEAAEQQLPSGRRRRDTPTPVPGGVRWVPAGRQGDTSARGQPAQAPKRRSASPVSLLGGVVLLRRSVSLGLQLRVHLSELLLQDRRQS